MEEYNKPDADKLEKKSFVAAAASEDIVEKAIDRLGETISHGVEKYFEYQDKKITLETQVEKETIKSQRQLNLLSIGLLAFILLLATMVVLFAKDLPPALNSLLSFIAGCAVVGVRSFDIKKRQQPESPKS